MNEHHLSRYAKDVIDNLISSFDLKYTSPALIRDVFYANAESMMREEGVSEEEMLRRITKRPTPNDVLVESLTETHRHIEKLWVLSRSTMVSYSLESAHKFAENVRTEILRQYKPTTI